MCLLCKNAYLYVKSKVFFLESQNTNGVTLHLNIFFTFVEQLFDISSFILLLEDILKLYFVC